MGFESAKGECPAGCESKTVEQDRTGGDIWIERFPIARLMRACTVNGEPPQVRQVLVRANHLVSAVRANHWATMPRLTRRPPSLAADASRRPHPQQPITRRQPASVRGTRSPCEGVLLSIGNAV